MREIDVGSKDVFAFKFFLFINVILMGLDMLLLEYM